MNPFGSALILFSGGCLAAAAFGSRPAWGRRLSYGLAAAASWILLLEAMLCLQDGSSARLVLPGPGPSADFRFALEPFSAVFLAVAAGLGFVSSLYAVGYAEEYDGRSAWLGAFYNLFLMAMAFVPAARNAFTFLFCWEGMMLASFFLVVLEHENASSAKAGYIYFVMSHASAAFLFALFFILHRASSSWEFEAFRIAGPQLPAGLKNVLFALALIGFGTKAGIVPLHLWLPYAHPAAPSHVSALMSGAMIKTGIYGLLLTTFAFLGGGPWWWGAVVLAVAAVTSLLGVLYALMEHDLKRLLAYHSVENIGIILMGAGAGMIFRVLGWNDMTLLALTASLYHTVNHAIFKGLLFLGAGSVVKAARTRNMEELGGLVKRMPATALFFLVGSMAISALPPFNGFVSEWLTFQALLSGFGMPLTPPRVLSLLVAAALALTSGLAAACFVKAFGVTFLALPRGDGARGADEASGWELSAMGILALACLALGVVPGWVTGLLRPAVEALQAAPPSVAAPAVGGAAALGGSYGDAMPAGLLAVAAVGALAAWLAARAVGGRARVRLGPTWACGLPGLTPRMEYTASAFSKPFRMLFSFLYRPLRELREDSSAGQYFPRDIRYSSEIANVFKEHLYEPAVALAVRGSQAIRRMQTGSVNVYLGYLSATVAALLLRAIWRGMR